MSCEFRAYHRATGRSVEVEMFVPGQQHGYNLAIAGEYLKLDSSHGGLWFAMLGNRRVAQGEVVEGRVDILFDDHEQATVQVSK